MGGADAQKEKGASSPFVEDQEMDLQLPKGILLHKRLNRK